MEAKSKTIRPAVLFGALVLGLGLALGLLIVLGQRPASEAQTAHPGPAAGPAGIAAADEAVSDEAITAAPPAAEAPAVAEAPPTPAPPAPIPAPPPHGAMPPDSVPAYARPASSAPGRPWGPGGPAPRAPGGVPASAPGGARGPSSDSPFAVGGVSTLASVGAGPAGALGGGVASGSPLGAEGAGGGFEPMGIPPMPNESADLAICLTSERVWGVVGAGETVTVSVDGAQMGADRADQIGFFWTTLYDASGNRPGLGAGDMVRIYHDGTLSASVTLRAITATVDVGSNVVSGTIGGSGFPISVTVYYAGSGEPAMVSYSQTVNTDGFGNFSADFTGVWDIIADDPIEVAYVDGGVEVHRHVYAARIVVLHPPLSGVNGWTAPGLIVTATVYSTTGMRSQEVGTADATGRYGWLWMDMEEGDTVVVELDDGTVMSRTVDVLSENIDPDSDRITGVAAPGAIVRGIVGNLTPVGWRTVQVSTTAEASGAYTVEFGSVADIMPGQWAGIHVADAEGDDLALWAPTPYVDVNQTHNQVYGYGPSSLGPDSDGRAVTLTLASTTTVYATTMDEWAWYSFDQNNGLPDIAPGDVVTVESEGYAWQGVVQVMTMTVEPDVDANRFTGEVVSPTDRVELSGHYYQGQLYPTGGQLDMLVTATSPFTASPSGFDVNGDLYYDVVHRTAGDYVERISRQTDGIGEVINANGVGGVFNPPGVAYTITLYNSGGQVKTQVTGNSGEPAGSFWINLWDYGQEQIEVGDYLQGQSATGFSHTVEIPLLSITGDPDTDIVSGQGPANAQVLVSVDNQGRGFVPTDDSGQFTIVVDQLQEVWGNGDLQWGDGLTVVYYDEKNTWLVSTFAWPQITARTTMEGRNAVFGYNAIPGNTIYITVTDPGDNVVATGTTTMGTCDWCDYWLDLPTGTLTPNNTVTVDFGDGFIDSMTVLTLTAEANPDSDVVTVTAPAGTHVSVYMDGPNGGWDWGWSHPTLEVGSEGYVVFDVSGEYDIVYGTVFYVHTYQAHGHQTEYEFWLPAPDVGVWKGTVGGFARPGGKYVYQIIYWNDGNGVATDTLIVDTLPVSTTWAGDTSGLTPEISDDGSVITWNLGTLPPPGNNDNWGVFAVTLDVAGDVPTGTGSLTENCITITTSAPGDTNPGNESSCTGPVDVWESDVGVNIDKWPNPGDPTPGQEFEYHFRWCTDRGANFGPVWLTDTLPVSTTLLDWWTDWPWNMWTEVITTGSQLVLYAPGLPGDYCQQTYLRLLLDPDVPLGTVLQNTIVITTPGDVDPGNNQEVNTDARVGPPRYDMNTDKWFGGGVLVPGGWIRYGANWWNAGNTAIHAWLTDTLPPGTSYQSGSGWHHDNYEFEPITVTDEYAVWDLGEVGVSQGRGLDFSLDVSSAVTPGTVLTNCITVGITATEDTPWDNTACVTETINESGPNLRVRKWSWWEGDNQIHYHVQFENIGDQQIDNVWITDTLPISTTWDGWWELQFDGSRLSDQNLGSDVLMWQLSTLYPGDSGGIEFRASLDDPNDRPRWYTNTVEIDTPPGDVNPNDNIATTVDVKGEVERVEMWVASEGANMWGRVQPNAPITVTTALTQYTGTANEWGDWNIDGVEALDPGVTITVTAGAETLPIIVTIPDPFTAYASSITDTVWGQIDALDHAQIRVELYGYGGKDGRTDSSGNYSVTWSDIPRGGQGHVRYETLIDYAQVVMHRRFHTPDVILNVHYRDNWVEGNYDAGYTVLITVTTEGGSIKGTAVLTTGAVPWWGGQTGFSTNWQGWTVRPDIVPGDWVYGQVVENGSTSTARVGTITGYVDSAGDSITGTITASWFTQTLTVRCDAWGGPWGTPSKESSAGPNGDPPYFCQWNPTSEWDVLPGQDIGVFYREPDGDWVGNTFREPAPNLSVDKYGQGQPAPGGNYIYRINYHNHGDAAATGVVLTDTLPTGMTYITDTSGLSPTLDGQAVIWDWGSMGAGTHSYFDVFVSVDGGLTSGERVTNVVDIATDDYDADPGNNHHEWWTEVVANDTHLNIGKGAWTGDPAPGQEFVYNINVCNNGSTASSQVTLTDTLHVSTTLRYWWAREPGWSEVYSDAQTLVLSKPTIPGWQCHEVYLRVYLDENAWQGMSISNTAVFTASNDLEDGDNETTWWGNANNPHTNLNITKAWDWGQLAPGGELHYNINYQNNGNMPVTDTIRITDTLPVSTTFGSISGFYGGPPVTPVFTGTDYVVFEIDGLDNGYSGGFQVALQVDSDAQPWTLLTNTVEIERQPVEDSYEDNISTAVETLYPHGPNLRVRKWGDWHGWGNGHNAWYQMVVENVGDAAVNENVTITDTYPVSMSLSGGVGIDWYSGWWEWHDNPAEHYFTATVQPLWPGGRALFGFNTQIPGSDPVPGGLILTNTVEVMLVPTDTYAADNVDLVVLTTGPDLYVEKTLVDGTFLPGEVVTFSLRYGNSQPGHTWWWNTQGNAWVTDTLPAELEFITATRGSWGWAPFTPDVDDGTHVAWNVGTVWSGWWDEIYLTVRIADTAEGGDLFTNHVEIASDQSSDVEPYYDNNSDEYDVLITLPRFSVGKVYTGSRVAGTVLTYTLTVTNSGNLTGTDVVLSDTLPAGLTYGGSDGVYSGGTVTWTITSIAPNNGAASRWFSGILTCTGSVSNDDYRVVTSTQGVASPAGAPVVFDIVTPTITASLVRDPAVLVVSQTVHFTASASTDGGALSYAWAFGDGTTVSGGLTASHVYTRPGVYTAIFTATDGCGYAGVATATVTVNAPTFGVTFVRAPAALVGCGTVAFTSTATTDGPDIVGWGWAFGDSSVGTGQTTSHLYTAVGAYTVTHTVTDGLGYHDTGVMTNAVVVNPSALNAAFSQSGTSVAVSTTVAFTDTSTTGGGPPIVAREWDFGDSSAHVFDAATASHVYGSLGTFTVTLTVTDTCGYSKRAMATVTVRAPALDADFVTSPSPASILVGDTVLFTDTSITEAGIVDWRWNFGDGGTGTGRTASHTYTEVGAYTVTLAVTDALGYSDVEVKPNVVVVSLGCTPLVSVTFAYAPLNPLVHAPVVFTATHTPADATQPVTYTWDFGDGGSGSGPVVQHTYTASGAHTVSVTAYNLCTLDGVTHQESITIAPQRIYLPLVLRDYP